MTEISEWLTSSNLRILDLPIWEEAGFDERILRGSNGDRGGVNNQDQAVAEAAANAFETQAKRHAAQGVYWWIGGSARCGDKRPHFRYRGSVVVPRRMGRVICGAV